MKATRASRTLTVSFIVAFQRFALGKPTRGQAEQNGGLPGSGELSHQTSIPPVLRSQLRNPLAAHRSLKTADSCCQNIISIWPYTITARQQVPLCLQSARPHKRLCWWTELILFLSSAAAVYCYQNYLSRAPESVYSNGGRVMS